MYIVNEPWTEIYFWLLDEKYKYTTHSWLVYDIYTFENEMGPNNIMIASSVAEIVAWNKGRSIIHLNTGATKNETWYDNKLFIDK